MVRCAPDSEPRGSVSGSTPLRRKRPSAAVLLRRQFAAFEPNWLVIAAIVDCPRREFREVCDEGFLRAVPVRTVLVTLSDKTQPAGRATPTSLWPLGSRR